MIHAAGPHTECDELRERALTADRAVGNSPAVDERRLQEVLHDRAQRLAAASSQVDTLGERTPFLVLRSGKETYGVALSSIARVFPDTPITPVPGSRDTLLGIANLDGTVRSVLELRSLLGLADHDDASCRYVLLLRRHDRHVGLRVEQIEEVRQVPLTSVAAADKVRDSSACYIHGVTRDKLILLRADAFFEHCIREEQMT